MTEDTSNVMLNGIVDEILSSEGAYQRYLDIAVTLFANPLKEQQLLSEEIWQQLFADLIRFKELSSQLLESCLSQDKTFDKITAGGICRGFLKCAPFLKIYVEYALRFAKSSQLLVKLKSEDERLAVFIDFQQELKEAEFQRIDSLLIMPIQRIPRYKLLFEQLLEYIDPNHPDYEECSACLNLIESIVSELDSTANIPHEVSRNLLLESKFKFDKEALTPIGSPDISSKTHKSIENCNKNAMKKMRKILNCVLHPFGGQKIASPETSTTSLKAQNHWNTATTFAPISPKMQEVSKSPQPCSQAFMNSQIPSLARILAPGQSGRILVRHGLGCKIIIKSKSIFHTLRRLSMRKGDRRRWAETPEVELGTSTVTSEVSYDSLALETIKFLQRYIVLTSDAVTIATPVCSSVKAAAILAGLKTKKPHEDVDAMTESLIRENGFSLVPSLVIPLHRLFEPQKISIDKVTAEEDNSSSETFAVQLSFMVPVQEAGASPEKRMHGTVRKVMLTFAHDPQAWVDQISGASRRALAKRLTLARPLSLETSSVWTRKRKRYIGSPGPLAATETSKSMFVRQKSREKVSSFLECVSPRLLDVSNHFTSSCPKASTSSPTPHKHFAKKSRRQLCFNANQG